MVDFTNDKQASSLDLEVVDDEALRAYESKVSQGQEGDSTSDGRGMIRLMTPRVVWSIRIDQMIREEIPNYTEAQIDAVTRRFYEHIRERSWLHGIDWDVAGNQVSVPIPNRISQERILHTNSRNEQIEVVGMLALLIRILESVDSAQLYKQMTHLGEFDNF